MFISCLYLASNYVYNALTNHRATTHSNQTDSKNVFYSIEKIQSASLESSFVRCRLTFGLVTAKDRDYLSDKDRKSLLKSKWEKIDKNNSSHKRRLTSSSKRAAITVGESALGHVPSSPIYSGRDSKSVFNFRNTSLNQIADSWQLPSSSPMLKYKTIW